MEGLSPKEVLNRVAALDFFKPDIEEVRHIFLTIHSKVYSNFNIKCL